MSELDEIKKTVNELKSIHDIDTLMIRYCHLVDSRKYDELRGLFTPDAKFDYGFMGQYNGTEELVNKFFRGLVDAAPFMAHMVHNPLIEVSGDTATGAWYLTAQTTLANGQAYWVQGVYRDTLKRVAGSWKISSLKCEFMFFTPYDEGWAKTRMVSLS